MALEHGTDQQDTSKHPSFRLSPGGYSTGPRTLARPPARVRAAGKGRIMPIGHSGFRFSFKNRDTASMKAGQATKQGTFTLPQSSLRHGLLCFQRLNVASWLPEDTVPLDFPKAAGTETYRY